MRPRSGASFGHKLSDEPSEEDKIKSQIDLYRTQARNLRADAEERDKRADELHSLLRGRRLGSS